MDASRVQKRLLHLLAQAGEGHMNERLVAEVPTPELGDVCHPAKKSLGTASFKCFCERVNTLTNGRRSLRDGRLLKRERKVKNVMALSRFLQKKNGLYGQQDKLTLQELGLSELAPTHSHRRRHVCPML